MLYLSPFLLLVIVNFESCKRILVAGSRYIKIVEASLQTGLYDFIQIFVTYIFSGTRFWQGRLYNLLYQGFLLLPVFYL